MKIALQFSDCPTECTKNGDLLIPNYDADRFAFCDVCPQKRAKEKFRALSESLIEQRFGNRSGGKNYRFDDLLSLLHDVRNMQDVPKNELSVKSGILLSVFLQEKNKKERLDEIERQRKSKK